MSEFVEDSSGIIFSIQRYSIYDGPGIRTTVFLKGCPLRCIWCQNPESHIKSPEIAIHKEKCMECFDKKCLAACPTGALELTSGEGFVKINRNLCNLCMQCVSSCSKGGLVKIGQIVSVEDIMREVSKDVPFYQNSGGGVTLSGGEPLAQPGFCKKLLERCKKDYIHTALDTSGYADWAIFKELIKFTDLVLYDLKLMDPSEHKKFTGVDNELILKNLEKIVEENVPVIIRIPLIPKYTANKDNIEAIKKFITKLKIEEVDLLPYNPLAEHKYEILGRNYALKDLKQLEDDQIIEFKKIMEDEFKVRVVR
jgi:pyruvate formate lyase activating enzyme